MATKSRKASTTDTLTIKALSTEIAESLDSDAGIVAKKVRGVIRRNFDTLAPLWPGLEDAKENRDGNRYPPMPREAADAIVARMKATKSDDEDQS